MIDIKKRTDTIRNFMEQGTPPQPVAVVEALLLIAEIIREAGWQIARSLPADKDDR